MSEKLETQCWICPYCWDDHKFEGPCKQEDLKSVIRKQNLKLDFMEKELKELFGAMGLAIDESADPKDRFAAVQLWKSYKEKFK